MDLQFTDSQFEHNIINLGRLKMFVKKTNKRLVIVVKAKCLWLYRRNI